MAEAGFGPVVLQSMGDTYAPAARLTAIVWEGTTTAGDTCEVRDPLTNLLLWAGRTPDTQTYLGITLGPHGMGAPHGFRLTKTISGTRVLVYLMEL